MVQFITQINLLANLSKEIPLSDIEKEYDKCLMIEDNNFYYGQVSCYELMFDAENCQFDENITIGGNRITIATVWEQKDKLIELLFKDYCRGQKGWLETVLHILHKEESEKYIVKIVKNLSGIRYDIFQAIYQQLLRKEWELKKNEKLIKDVKLKESESKKITALHKLRASMVRHIREDAIDYQKKIVFCLKTETCLEVMLAIISRISLSQITSGFSMADSDWITIEILDKNPEAYDLTADHPLKELTSRVLKARDEIKKYNHEGHDNHEGHAKTCSN